jgi:hypothetical protein
MRTSQLLPLRRLPRALTALALWIGLAVPTAGASPVLLDPPGGHARRGR